MSSVSCSKVSELVGLLPEGRADVEVAVRTYRDVYGIGGWKIRYEHRANIHLAFLQLGCALISWRFLG